jgi:hypothetical protein
MSPLSRREFCNAALNYAAAMAVLSTGVLDLHANPLGLPIGCQTWPVREMIASDFPGTIRQLAAAGFQSIELCSPVGYSEYGFGGLAKYKPAEIKRILNEAGITCVSSHFTIGELRANQADRIAWAKRPRPHADDRSQSRRSGKAYPRRRQAGGRRIQQDG